MLSLLIPKKKAKHMDVYMEPLVEELNTLWEGIHVYDMSQLPLQDGPLPLRQY